MLVADRRKLLNGNSFRLGVSGSGKSFSAKEEIVDLALSTEDDILILDPESEFGSLVEALNGEVITISATSNTHLNALDMDSAYGNDKNPLIEKSEFILSLFEQLVGLAICRQRRNPFWTAVPQMCTGTISEAVTRAKRPP